MSVFVFVGYFEEIKWVTIYYKYRQIVALLLDLLQW